MKKFWCIGIVAVGLLSGCTQSELSRSAPFPTLPHSTIAVFPFANYTDTPQAGERAANLFQGILAARGYGVNAFANTHGGNPGEKCRLARSRGAQYLIDGALSEWRYKTGIDGEPAVSLSIRLLDARNCRTLWSATGSDSDWGNASIGTTAQKLMTDLIE